MKKLFLFMFFIAAGAYYSGTILANTQPKKHSDHFFVEAGDIFTITVESNAGTGASWNVQPFDEDCIKFVDVTRTSTTQHMPGMQIHEHYNFKALKPGTATIIMDYGRPWEKVPWKINTYTITIE